MKLRIAFIACNKNPSRFREDPSFIYRCENPAVYLQTQGHHVELLHYTTINTRNHYDIIVVHRPAFRAWHSHFNMAFMLRRLRKQSALLIADFDDLVFDPSHANASPGVVNQLVSLKQTEKNFRSHLKTLSYFDRFTVSTSPLKSSLEKIRPDAQIKVIYNTPHQSWFAVKPPQKSNTHFTLGYFPGTKSHDQDFASIAEPLADFLADNKQTRLSITGVFAKPPNLPSAQVTFCEKVPFQDYWQHVQQIDVNLAPLQATEFNKHKSALKAIEAGFWNTPTIASPIPDMQRLVNCGVYLPNTSTEWWQALNQSLQQYNNNAPISIRQKLLAHYNIEHATTELIAWINET